MPQVVSILRRSLRGGRLPLVDLRQILGARAGGSGFRPALEGGDELVVRDVDRGAADSGGPAPEHELVVEVLAQGGHVASAVLCRVLQVAAELRAREADE